WNVPSEVDKWAVTSGQLRVESQKPQASSLAPQIQLGSRELQAVLLSKHRGAERSVREQVARDADDVFGRDALYALDRLVEAELAVEVDLLPREVRHAAGRALEAEHQAALEMILGAPQLRVRRRRLHAAQLV